MTRTRAAHARPSLRLSVALAAVAVAAGLAATAFEAGDYADPAASTTQGSSGSASDVPADAVPTLPPGDPGPDAPPMPDPGAPTEKPGHGAARTTVPDEALLDLETVGGVLGGSWSKVPAPADSCDAPRPPSAVATRTQAVASDPRAFVQTVSTYPSDEDAEEAVSAVLVRLRACGWTAVAAPPLGESSAQATRGGAETVLVLAAEGVTVTLLGTGRSAADPASWNSLADVALGSSCPAAPDGCH